MRCGSGIDILRLWGSSEDSARAGMQGSDDNSRKTSCSGRCKGPELFFSTSTSFLLLLPILSGVGDGGGERRVLLEKMSTLPLHHTSLARCAVPECQRCCLALTRKTWALYQLCIYVHAIPGRCLSGVAHMVEASGLGHQTRVWGSSRKPTHMYL